MGVKLKFAGTGNPRVKNGFRIEVAEEKKGHYSLSYLVNAIFYDALKVKKTDIVCLQEFRKDGRYVLVLSTMAACQNLFRTLTGFKESTLLDGLIFTILYSKGDVPVVVFMHNPFCSHDSITAFLRRHCIFVQFSHRINNEEGLWMGKYKYFVMFAVDPQGPGGIHYPPMNFSIGRDTGFLYFPDAPFFCRRCSTYGHIQESCSNQPTCRRCNETGHMARDCKNQVKCDACGEDGHVLRECRARITPRSFAQVTAVRPATPTVVAETPVSPLADIGEAVAYSEEEDDSEVEDILEDAQVQPRGSAGFGMEISEVESPLPLLSGVRGEGEIDLSKSPALNWTETASEEPEGGGQGDLSAARSSDEDEPCVSRKKPRTECPSVAPVCDSPVGSRVYPTDVFSPEEVTFGIPPSANNFDVLDMG
ncbi:uncharacterized protein [Ranitomeya imitator]|uniref:uncharacterized protein n=1 Tax=Ranitomeya imitator TaxID=111125 RepID=UPI0037E90025